MAGQPGTAHGDSFSGEVFTPRAYALRAPGEAVAEQHSEIFGPVVDEGFGAFQNGHRGPPSIRHACTAVIVAWERACGRAENRVLADSAPLPPEAHRRRDGPEGPSRAHPSFGGPSDVGNDGRVVPVSRRSVCCNDGGSLGDREDTGG